MRIRGKAENAAGELVDVEIEVDEIEVDEIEVGELKMEARVPLPTGYEHFPPKNLTRCKGCGKDVIVILHSCKGVRACGCTSTLKCAKHVPY